MDFKIKELKLENFKGQRYFLLEPKDGVTSIHGTNGVGKTTLCDAWMWLLTGKDTKDRSDYEIKTRNSNNEVLHGLEYSVSAKVEVGGISYDLSRIYKENWVKPTGEKERILKSHTTDYIFDTIPLAKKSEYDMRINQLIGDAERFKLLSSPRYFLNIDWRKRRQLLMELAAVTDESVMMQLASSNKEFAQLLEELKNNNLDDFRKKVNADKKELQKNINEIPVKIREATLAIPEELDYNEINNILIEKERELTDVDLQISDVVKSYESQANSIREEQQGILSKEQKLAKLESDAKIEAERINSEENKAQDILNAKLKEIDSEIRSLLSEQSIVINRIHGKENEIKASLSTLERLRNEYTALNSLMMDENKAFCPSCKQSLPEEDVMNIIREFNLEKESNIQANIDKGKSENVTKGLLESQLDELNIQKNGITEKIEQKHSEKDGVEDELRVELGREKNSCSFEDILSGNLEYAGLKQEVEILKSQIKTIQQPDTSELRSKKAEINNCIYSLKDQLSLKKVADNQRKRIQELECELKNLSQELATLEGKEFIADKFNRAKIEAIESGINGLFESIKWKMFNPLMNGGEEECCEALIDGKPYQAANNAGQINAGIECINTLSKFYGMHLPIFVDNAESVVTLTPTKSQIIRFVVDEKYNQLTVI